MKPKKRKAIFLDRDGVIVKEVDHLHRPDQLELLPESAEAISLINQSGYLAIMVSNQAVVARGMCTEQTVEEVHQKLNSLLEQEGRAKLDGMYYCPHHPKFTDPCSCRKPEIGLVLKAEKQWNIDLNNSYFVGDKESDLLCGMKAGMKTVGVKTGYGCANSSVSPNFMFKNLLEAVRFILKK